MSSDYRQATNYVETCKRSEALRVWCQRPGRKDIDGKPQYTTEQHHKKECDVNQILKKYDKTGLITHVSRFEARFGDLTGVDFKSAMDMIAEARSQFQGLPSAIRKRFENNPQKLIEFMEDPGNRDEAIKLGLVHSSTPPEMDGLGEHVKPEPKKD